MQQAYIICYFFPFFGMVQACIKLNTRFAASVCIASNPLQKTTVSPRNQQRYARRGNAGRMVCLRLRKLPYATSGAQEYRS